MVRRATVTACPRVAWALVFGLLAAAVPVSQAIDTSAIIGNVAPTVVSATLPASSISPTSGSTTGVTSTIVVEDLNGHNDVTSVTVEVLKPDGSTTHLAASAATKTSGSLAQGTYTHTFNMQYYDDPALTTSTYKVKVVATDSQGATGSNLASLAVFNFAELAALNAASASVSFGTLDPGATSAAVTLNVQNYGNVQIDAQVSGGALTHATEAASVAVGNVAYSLASDMSGSAALTGSAVTLASFDLAKGSGSSKATYWRVAVPSGTAQWVPEGTYAGTVTIGAVKG